MDYNDIRLDGTSDVKSYCDTLDTGVQYYKNLVSELKNTRTQIVDNWDGNTNDIIDITQRLDGVITDFEKLIPGISQLSSAVRNLADEASQIGNNDPDSGNVVPNGNPTPDGETTTPPQGTSTEEPKKNDSIFSGGFWKEIGHDFANDWDYSDTADHGSLWTVIGDTGQGLLNTVGSVANTIGRLGGGIWGAIFG